MAGNAGKGMKPQGGVNWSKFREGLDAANIGKKEEQSMRITDTHVYFYGSTPFSNWHDSRRQFIYKNQWFDNSEQAFMYEKALFFNDAETAEMILLKPYPKEAKALGRQVKNFDTAKWGTVALENMISILKSKFQQNEDFKQLLLDTGNRILVEASPYDKIWGIGLHWSDDAVLDEKNWQGTNLLGKALMEVRSNLVRDYSVLP